MSPDEDWAGLLGRLQADPRAREAMDFIRASGRSAAMAAWATLKERIKGAGNVVDVTGSDGFTLAEAGRSLGLQWAVEPSTVVYLPSVRAVAAVPRVVVHTPLPVIEDLQRPGMDERKAFAILWVGVALAGWAGSWSATRARRPCSLVTAAMQPIYLLLFGDETG